MDLFCDVFHLDLVHVIMFQIIHNLTHPVTLQFTVFCVGKIPGEVLQHTAPQFLQGSGDIQFIELLLFLIQTNDLFYIICEKLVPGL